MHLDIEIPYLLLAIWAIFDEDVPLWGVFLATYAAFGFTEI